MKDHDRQGNRKSRKMMKLNNPFARAIEKHLTESADDAVAAKILQEGKSLKGACDSIREVAKKNAVGRRQAVSMKMLIGWPEKYYEINRAKSMKR